VTISVNIVDRSLTKDNQRGPSGINKIELYIDMTKVMESTTSSLTYVWATEQYKDGYHTIMTKSYDNVGNVGIVSVGVRVVNAEWLFLVYLDGDNDLEKFAIQDMNEMEMVGSTNKIKILVLFDRIPGYDTSNGDWNNARLYYVTKDYDANNINSVLIKDYNELDMSDTNTLKDFIIYGMTNYSAKKACLVFWNHGDGVYPRSPSKDDVQRGIAWDNTTPGYPWNCLTIDKVIIALESARQVTGKKIDAINMDACLTQMFEVAWEWQYGTDYLVGSEAIVPGYGNDYYTLLYHLTQNPTMTPSQFAKTIVDDYYAFYNGKDDTTYSYIKLGSTFDTVKSKFAVFAKALYEADDNQMAIIKNVWNNVTYFDKTEL